METAADKSDHGPFPQWQDLYNVDETKIEKLPWYSKELDYDLKKELEDRRIKDGKFLDLGTGPATQAFQLAKLGFSVTGTDISESAIARANSLSKDQVRFVVDNITQSKLGDNQFDYIFDRGCFHVLKPSDRPMYVSKVKSMLTDNGMHFLKTFSIQEPRIDGPYHFSPDTIKELFEKDFEILSSKETVFQGTLSPLPRALFSVMKKRETA